MPGEDVSAGVRCRRSPATGTFVGRPEQRPEVRPDSVRRPDEGLDGRVDRPLFEPLPPLQVDPGPLGRLALGQIRRHTRGAQAAADLAKDVVDGEAWRHAATLRGRT